MLANSGVASYARGLVSPTGSWLAYFQPLDHFFTSQKNTPPASASGAPINTSYSIIRPKPVGADLCSSPHPFSLLHEPHAKGWHYPILCDMQAAFNG